MTLEKAWEQAKATAGIEGITFSDEDERVIKAVVTGEMTREELIKKLREVY